MTHSFRTAPSVFTGGSLDTASIRRRRLLIACAAAAAATAGALATPRIVSGDQWCGDAQVTTSRGWGVGLNWMNGVVPPATDINIWGIEGDGTVTLDAPRTAAGLIFQDFTNCALAPNGTANVLTLNPTPLGINTLIMTGENLRDTYACDYFTAGPRVEAPIILGGQLDINMGIVNRSALMISGQIVGGFNNTITLNSAVPDPRSVPPAIRCGSRRTTAAMPATCSLTATGGTAR